MFNVSLQYSFVFASTDHVIMERRIELPFAPSVGLDIYLGLEHDDVYKIQILCWESTANVFYSNHIVRGDNETQHKKIAKLKERGFTVYRTTLKET